ncbi:lipoprotein-releasing system permease protein [Parabacteroides sp. PFB2-12]|uniref:FtsX-like permease family protein n=1 Tax=unclassified Parabacteroides TaxID=2649774 RepID=UPI0024768E39|nr:MULTISPECIES: FtsX-like permease family protein [unclassified Parabacteroides]MDH6343356.1 lipoprotein-releasing system permease protein [Parabacteroides sp. PM6-13]MDH6390372.1 lipoprotein-releasing system permease protein [Parabacteroides sp. PFB2-12]
MNLSFYIARRYLFSKKSHNAINIISMVSVCGVLISTVALICALSVFNGFNSLVAMMFSSLDPELKIMPRTGKVFDPQASEIEAVRQLPEIEIFSEVLQENALIKCGDRQVIGIVKGVDSHYGRLTDMAPALVDGEFRLREDIVNYATLGMGLAYTLGTRVGFVTPLEIYAPKRNERINTLMPQNSFDVEYAYTGAIFRINQAVYDDSYMIVPIELARTLYRYEKEVSSIELKLSPEANVQAVKKQLCRILGDNYLVQDRHEQHADAFRMMQVEKMVTYLILCFILVIALFNLVGSISMLINEKKDDIKTLRNMGADNALIRRIFLFEGWLISGIGAVAGLVIGLILCWLQIRYGLISLGVSGAFIIDAYPIQVLFSDVLLVFVTVITIGFLASWYPVRKMKNN